MMWKECADAGVELWLGTPRRWITTGHVSHYMRRTYRLRTTNGIATAGHRSPRWRYGFAYSLPSASASSW